MRNLLSKIGLDRRVFSFVLLSILYVTAMILLLNTIAAWPFDFDGPLDLIVSMVWSYFLFFVLVCATLHWSLPFGLLGWLLGKGLLGQLGISTYPSSILSGALAGFFAAVAAQIGTGPLYFDFEQGVWYLIGACILGCALGAAETYRRPPAVKATSNAD